MTDSSRLDELRRRVQQDPASIAFAALADEYRRAGLFEQAIETCRAGLVRHPAYLSARVTLGRALMEIGEFDEAQQHLEQVIRVAPDNLAAIRALAEIHHRRGDSPDAYAVAADLDADTKAAPAPPARVVPMPPRVAVPSQTAPPIGPMVGATPPAAPVSISEPAPAGAKIAEPASAIPIKPRVDVAPAEVEPRPAAAVRAPAPAAPAPAIAGSLDMQRPAPPAAPAIDPVRERLEQLLAGIARARASRPAGGSLSTR
jgi:tetratricopeptide (TPR) repeat protein